MHPLEAVTPLDGRYRKYAEALAADFSEMALIRNRIRMESEYLLALSELEDLLELRRFTDLEYEFVRSLYKDMTLQDAEIVKALETKGYGDIDKTNHDVKAVEYHMRLKLLETSLADCVEWIHFGLTSEDTNNIAYGLMLRSALENVVIPLLAHIHRAIKEAAKANSAIAMLARTHGQPAIGTTLGKEQNVFAARLMRQIEQLKSYQILVKLNGASGNYAAHVAAAPHVDWILFTKYFIARLNMGARVQLKPNLVTTQIDPHDTYAELFSIIMRINNILIDLCQDMWRYISDDWLVQKPVEGEVGSSTMPQKVNPIDLENGEGNLGIANCMFEFFCRKLPISRLQRDLSDSTVERSFGSAFGYSLVAYNSILRGLGKVSANLQAIASALSSHPEIITEGIQTILRRVGVQSPYEKLKGLSRGRKLTLADIAEFIKLLEVKPEVTEELLRLSPESYIGLSVRLALMD